MAKLLGQVFVLMVLGALLVLNPDVLAEDKYENICPATRAVCSKTGSINGVLEVAQTVASGLRELVAEAQAKLEILESSICTSGSDGGTPPKYEIEGCLEAPPDCAELQKGLGFKTNGVYRIWPQYLNRSIMVYCDMETENGGWTIIQRRGDFSTVVNFYRKWDEYKNGFGNLKEDFWLGNDAIFALTNQREYMLRVEMEDFNGTTRYAQYTSFVVDSEIRKYKLTIGGYSGDAGDSLGPHTEAKFSTHDIEGDEGKCSRSYKGGWWYYTCHTCNLNGRYLRGNQSTFADGVNWKTFRGYKYSLKNVEMKIRPRTQDIPNSDHP